jgi:hypothetical protein
VEGASVMLDGVAHHLAALDFGSGSVDAWRTGLAGGELGVESSRMLDVESHELILDDQRVALTALEFELLRYF